MEKKGFPDFTDWTYKKWHFWIITILWTFWSEWDSFVNRELGNFLIGVFAIGLWISVLYGFVYLIIRHNCKKLGHIK